MTASIYLDFGSGIAVVAVIIYAWLRHLSSGRGREHPLTVVRRHAWWTAFIALFASNTLGLAGMWTVKGASSDPATAPVQEIWDHLPQALAPGLWLGAIYLLGQFTWPRQVGTRRSAALRIRRMTDYLPRALTAVFAGSMLVTLGAMVWAWNAPGTVATLAATGTDGRMFIPGPTHGNEPGFDSRQTEYSALGALPGNQVAPLLLSGVLLVLIAVIVLLFVVTSRPALSVLETEDDATLRELWMNRLLRTGVFITAGFASAAVQFAAFAREQHAMVSRLSHGAGATAEQIGSSSPPDWFAGGWFLLVGLAMLFWRAPALTVPDASDSPCCGSSPGYRAALSVLTAVQFAVVLALLIAGSAAVFVTGGSTVQSEAALVQGGPVGAPIQASPDIVVGSGFSGFRDSASVLLVIVLVYYALQFSVSAWIGLRLCDGRTPYSAARKLLPRWFVIVNTALVAAALLLVGAYAIGSDAPATVSAWWLTAVLALATALGAAMALHARTNGPLLLGSGREDATLRIIIAHRAIRFAGGTGLICLGLISDALAGAGPLLSGLLGPRSADDPAALSSPSAIVLVLLGLLWSFLPAATVGSRHADSPLDSASARKQAGSR